MSREITFDQWKARFFRENGDWKDLSEVELYRAWHAAWTQGYDEGMHEGREY